MACKKAHLAAGAYCHEDCVPYHSMSKKVPIMLKRCPDPFMQHFAVADLKLHTWPRGQHRERRPQRIEFNGHSMVRDEWAQDQHHSLALHNWPFAGRKKFRFIFFKTIVFNALIQNILLSRLSDEQKCIFSHLNSADFETVRDLSTSPWRNNLDIPWCNSLVITLMT